MSIMISTTIAGMILAIACLRTDSEVIVNNLSFRVVVKNIEDYIRIKIFVINGVF